MSLSNDPVPVLGVIDPRIDLDVDPFYLVEKGAGEVIYRKYEADSFGGGTININTQLSDRRTVVDCKVKIKTTFAVRIAALGGYAPFTVGSPIYTNLAVQPFCPRFSPLISACTNAVLNLNGKQFSQPVNRFNTPLMKYCTSTEESAYDFSLFPAYQDILPEFYDYPLNGVPTYAAGVPQASPTAGNAMNSNQKLEAYLANTRAAWLQNVAVEGTAATTSVLNFSYETEEILPLSPLIWGHKNIKGLSGLDTLGITLNYDQTLLNASMQYCPVGLEANSVSTFTISQTISDCSAEFIYFSPQANMEVPPVLRYRYNDIQHVAKNIPTSNVTGIYDPRTAKTGGGISTFTSDSITLQGMPKRIYVFIRRQGSAINSTTPDTYAYISNINVTLGNRSGILAEATPQSLYTMAVKNGYKGSWDHWRYLCGSVLCIDFAQDIPMGILDAPGTLSKMNLQFNVTGQSLYYDYKSDDAAGVYAAAPLELNTVIVYDGIVVIKNGQVLQEPNDVSPLDVVNAIRVQKVNYRDVIDYAGGSYAGGAISKYVDAVKRGFSKVKALANKAAPYVKEYGPKVLKVAEKAIPVVASILAAGYTENEIYGIMEQYSKTERKAIKPKATKGGARASKSALSRRAIM